MDFKKLIQKKMGAGEMLAPMEKDAHKKALLSLRKEATETMKPEFDGLKKVTVASDSSAGLKKGLELADSMAPDASPEHEAMETPEEEKMEHMSGMEMQDEGNPEYPSLSPEECAMDLDQVDQKLQDLMKLRENLKA